MNEEKPREWTAVMLRAGGRTPRTPGGPRVCQGPHVMLRMNFFSSFLMFSKYL